MIGEFLQSFDITSLVMKLLCGLPGGISPVIRSPNCFIMPGSVCTVVKSNAESKGQ